MEPQTAQMRVMPNAILSEGCGRAGGNCPYHCERFIQTRRCSCGGTIFYTTPSRARALINAGAAELLNTPGAPLAPRETPIVGPRETPMPVPSEKKYSAVAPDGRSTDSQQSSETGTAAPSSLSAADQALPESNADSSPRRGPGRPRKSV